jgi:uncharacterized membrane protein
LIGDEQAGMPRTTNREVAMVTQVQPDSGDKRVLVAGFDSLGGANLAAKKLQNMEKLGQLDVDNSVTVTKNAFGKIDVKNFAEHTVGEGVKIGALVGGVIGLIFPPSLLASAALGGMVGGMTAKLRESGFDPGLIQEMAQGMAPGTSMLVTVVPWQWTDEVEAALTGDASRIAWAEMTPAQAETAVRGAEAPGTLN